MNVKRIGLLSLALVLALGTLGIGYAQWTEALSITGTVRTAVLNWEFTSAWTNDAGTLNDWVSGEGFLNITQLDRHIGSTTANLSNTDFGPGNNLCTVILRNVFPGYYGEWM